MRYAAAALLVLYGCVSPAPRDLSTPQGIESLVASMYTHREIEHTLRPGEEPFVVAAQASLSDHFTDNDLRDSFSYYINGLITEELRDFFLERGMFITYAPTSDKPEFELWHISARKKVKMALWGAPVELERRILGAPIIRGRYEQDEREALILGSNDNSSSIETFSRNTKKMAAMLYHQFHQLKGVFGQGDFRRVEGIASAYPVSQFMIYRELEQLCEGTEEDSMKNIQQALDNTVVIHEAAHALFHIDSEGRSETFMRLYIFNTELVARLTELRYTLKPSFVLGQQLETATEKPYNGAVDIGRLACGTAIRLVMNTAIVNREKLKHANMSKFLETHDIDDAFVELSKLTDIEIRQLAATIVYGRYIKPGLSPAESFIQMLKRQENELE